MPVKSGFLSYENQCEYNTFSLNIFENSSRIPNSPFMPVQQHKADLKWMQTEYSYPLKTICIAYI